MNERIQELAKLADPGYTGNSEDGLGASLVGNDAIEKFAELIVQECINCTKEWRDAVRVGSDRDYSRGYVHGCDDSIVEMKIRFGVEE
jgi:hypothetical protein